MSSANPVLQPSPAPPPVRVAPSLRDLLNSASPSDIVGQSGREVQLPFATGVVYGDPGFALPSGPNQYIPNCSVICSVWPFDLSTAPLQFQTAGNPIYRLPGTPRGQFSCLRVYDTTARIRDFLSILNGGDDQQYQTLPIYAQDQAKAILESWSGGLFGTTDRQSLGIAILSGPLPTEEEWKALCAQRDRYMAFVVDHTDSCYQLRADKAKQSEFSSLLALARRCAAQLNIEDTGRYSWLAEHASMATKRCHLCQSVMNAAALYCEKCGDLAGEAIKTHRNVQFDPYLFAEVTRRLAIERERAATLAGSDIAIGSGSMTVPTTAPAQPAAPTPAPEPLAKTLANAPAAAAKSTPPPPAKTPEF